LELVTSEVLLPRLGRVAFSELLYVQVDTVLMMKVGWATINYLI